MRKSLIPILLSLVLIVSNAQAATKAGSPCSKAGAVSVVSGKKYICIKSGKKFVWNKGVLVVKASATPSATPTVKPTSQNVGFESELSPKTLAAYKDFIKTYKSRLTNEVPNIEFIIEERERELIGEQMRWFDLKRWGILVERVQKYNPQGAANIKPFHVLRPIPQVQIDRVTGNASAFPQNPGY
jgi:hypothetical protein